MKRIAEASVREIRDRADIVAVVSEHVRLEKSGADWRGLCPFHTEKTPSFYVVPAKRMFYCFGCQKGGDAVSFLRDLEGIGYREALETLANKMGIPLEYEDGGGEASGPPDDRDVLVELHERLAATFRWFLAERPEGSVAREYLESRGMGTEIAERFGLGYAPADRRWLRPFLRGKGYSEDLLDRSGLFAKERKDSGIFADRLMFPIKDPNGKVVAFGGRILRGEGPKYLNSPETAIFRKHENLFAVSEARQAIRDGKSAVVCEGYMDAIAFHAAGVKRAVAPLGTAFTEAQSRLLRRWAEKVELCFDADEAGRKAAAKALVEAARGGLRASVILVPGGKDPAEILQKAGAEELNKLPDSAINGDDFLIRRATSSFDIASAEGKARAVETLFPYIAVLDAAVRRDEFVEAASRALFVQAHSILADFARRASRDSAGPARGAEGEPQAPSRNPADLALLTALALHPELFAGFRGSVAAADLDDDGARELYIALEEAFRAEEGTTEAVLFRVRDEPLRTWVRERAAKGEFELHPERVVVDGARRVRARSLERKRERLKARMRDFDPERDGDEVSLDDLLYEKMFIDGELERIKDERHERS